MSYNPSQGYVAANKAGDTFTGPITTTGKKAAYRSVTANTALTATDEYLEVTGSTAIAVTLPDATATGNLKSIFNIKNSSTATTTLTPTGSQTIDGSATFPMPIQYQAITLICNGTSWSIF